MSLLPEKVKTPKAMEDLGEYYKQYRSKNRDHINRLERVKYYKDKYGLEEDFIKKFGEYSADVFKLHKDFIYIKENCASLIPHILAILQKIE